MPLKPVLVKYISCGPQALSLQLDWGDNGGLIVISRDCFIFILFTQQIL